MRHRLDTPELLDDATLPEDAALASLADLRRLNRFLFGISVTLGALEGWLAAGPKPATVLDLGTGSGQMAQALARWAARSHQAVRVLALDRVPRQLHHARAWNAHLGTPHVLLLAGDALRLPLTDQSVDYVTSSLFLHHFDEAALRHLFAECRRVARRGVAMSDLWRHPLPFALYQTLAEPLLVRSPITHFDSRASFRRAYRPAEIAALAGECLPGVRVSVQLPSFRWVLTSRWGTAEGEKGRPIGPPEG